MSGISDQIAIFGATKLYATGPEHGKVKHGMELLKKLNKSPVGDITTGHKPAYLGRINSINSSKVLKPKEADKGPGPVVGLQPVAVHQLCAYTCNIG